MSPGKKSVVAADETLALLDVGVYDRRTSHHDPRMEPFDAATVSLEPGVSLVEASAGTGKTYSITQLVLRLLLARRTDGEYRVRGIGSILVVTFTNAATDELITRVRSALREATEVFAGVAKRTDANSELFALRDEVGVNELPRLREALSSLDQLAIFTIHGFCKRVLEESALESGTPFGARFIEEDDLLVERIAQDWWRRTIYEDSELATLAVHLGWAHDAFLKDLKKWQRLPGTIIEPHVVLPQARATLARAMREFAQVWQPARAAAFLDERKWLASSPLKDAATREQAIRAGDELAAGNLLGALRLAKWCTSAAMLDEKSGMFKKPTAHRDAVATEPFVQACDAISSALATMASALRVSCLEDVHVRFAKEKRQRHMLGFDDLLRRLHGALEAGGTEGHLASAIRARYDAALIDEFQDTDPFQFPIFSTAFAGCPLFLIGDPKQAIYGFRGADLFAYMDAASKAERRYTLSQNWRSTSRMVGAVNGLFANQPNAFLYESIDFLPAKAARKLVDPLAADSLGALRWWIMPPDQNGKQLTKGEATRRSQAATVREIVRLLSPEPGRAALKPGQIAVLVRAGFEGVAIQDALRTAGVPSIVSGMDDILQSRELMELEAVLHAVLVTGDARGVRGALATELWGASAGEIHRLAMPEHEGEWQAIIERLTEWREQWVRFGFIRMVQGMLAHLEATERLLAHEDGERRVTNLRHAVELLHTAASEERLSPEGMLLWIANTRATGEEQAERTELRLESDADAVQIATIHKSKGLEYDVVFCPTLWASRRTKDDEPVLVHENGAVVFDHGSPSRDARGRLAAAEELAEELRLVYVALTRARFRCYVAWGAVNNQKTGIDAGYTALAYLLRSGTAAGAPADVTEAVPLAFAQSLGNFVDPLTALVTASGGAMSVEELGAEIAAISPWTSSAAPAAKPVCRTDLPQRESLQSWRVASFTSLTAARHTVDTDDARDVADSGTEQRPARVTDPRDFLAFPAGRLPGVALHELFERLDFSASPQEIRSLATEILTHAGMNQPVERIGAVSGMAERVLGATLAEAGFALRDVPRARTLREWTFHLPLGTIDGALLSRIFAAHGGELGRRYAPSLRHLNSDRVHGFLTGVVDLALEHGGRWYVVDWKSNHLGAEPESYEHAALEHEMFSSHYVLQYHLYLTALHRFLRLRLPGYDYESHVGGAWYAFLRGIDGSERGWFHDLPPRELIDALDAVMESAVPVEAAS